MANFTDLGLFLVCCMESSETGEAGVMGGLGRIGDALGMSRGEATAEARGWEHPVGWTVQGLESVSRASHFEGTPRPLASHSEAEQGSWLDQNSP